MTGPRLAGETGGGLEAEAGVEHLEGAGADHDGQVTAGGRRCSGRPGGRRCHKFPRIVTRKHFETAADNLRALLEDRAL